MDIKYGRYPGEFGPGIEIELTGNELAQAIETWLMAQGVLITGARTTTVNDGDPCGSARVFVDPGGFITTAGQRISGRGHAAP